MPCGWQGDRKSGVALAMRHRLQSFIHIRADGLRKGDEHPAYTPHRIWHSFTFLSALLTDPSASTPLRHLTLTLPLTPALALNSNLNPIPNLNLTSHNLIFTTLIIRKQYAFRNRKQTYCKWRQILRMSVISYLLDADSADTPMHWLATLSQFSKPRWVCYCQWTAWQQSMSCCVLASVQL